MCGIAGLLFRPAAPLGGDLARRVLELLRHRGPDDGGWLALERGELRAGREPEDAAAADAVLLSRRLSILDLSEAGWQPMRSEDDRYAIVFNGEIYNYLELRDELERLGHSFRTRTDTEVLLAAWAQWGTECLPRLVGMFAFALLDVSRRAVYLARDPFGIKPLFYAPIRGGLGFASEIAPLLELPGVGREASARHVFEYLRYGTTDHDDGTFFAGVRRLPAAHFAEVALDRPDAVQPRRYWSIDLAHRLDISLDDAAERFRELFLESMRLHLRSDVPVGCFLSGGLDSSAIAAAMRHLLGPDADIPTFSYVADEPRINEEAWVDVVAERTGLRPHKVRPTAAELPTYLPGLVAAQGEPFESLRVFVKHRVFELAHEANVKVVLIGQGADELLGGYNVFLTARLASLLRRGRFVAAARFARAVSARPTDPSLGSLVRAEGFLLPPMIRRSALRLGAGEDLVPDWLDAAWLRERHVVPAYRPQADGRDALREKLLLSVEEATLPQLLRREDRSAMAYSIECRVPFLVPALAGFLLALPESHLVAPDGVRKLVLRRAMRGFVPDEILDRQDKIGSATPEHRWLLAQRPWVDSLLGGEAARSVRPLRLDQARALWEQVTPAGRHNHVWRWLNLILWAERFQVEF
jgi:asparagine synthase (glutamine-hydrolysing)